MFCAGSLLRQFRYIRSRTHLFALLAAMTLMAGLSAQAQDQASKQFPDFNSLKAGETKAMSFKATPAGLPGNLSTALRASAASFVNPENSARYSTMASGSVKYYVVYLQFDSASSRERLRVPGVTVLTAIDRFADVFIAPSPDGKGPDEAAVKGLLSTPGLVWYEEAGEVSAPPPSPFQLGSAARGVPEQIVHGGYAGLTGKGVIVAIIDTGADFRNADFINFDGSGHPTSRFLYLWDTVTNAYDSSGIGSKAPYSYPNGSSIGTLYTREQLTAEVNSRSVRIPATDEGGHGTATTGIAAGNGNNSRGAYAGVAPQADIIVVRVASGGGSFDHGFLLNAAVAWIDSVAKREGKPVVFSCSFGGHGGHHDGLSVEERELDARFPANARGRAIAISAGNERTNGLHARTAYEGGDEPARLLWQSQNPGILHLFIHKQGGGPVDPDHLRWGTLVLNINGQQRQFPMPQSPPEKTVDPNSNELELDFAAPAGVVGLALGDDTGEPFLIDAYLPMGGQFHPAIRRDAEIVGTPGTTAAAITVASYDWNDQFSYQGKMVTMPGVCGPNPMQIGDVSCYSSIGYSRDGTVKPDIASPGQWFSAPYAMHPDGSGVNPKEWTVDSSGRYTKMNGTSSAAPYTAGVIALMMQKRPDITTGEIKTLLELNATQDSFTGTVPNPGWGYGKLDIAAVRAVLNAVH
ncbi:MAG: S8 family serine peptidase [Candidatus Acidiferrales bacterium]